MVQYLIRRLLLAAFTLLMILLVSYVLLRLAPGDPLVAYYGERTEKMSVEERQRTLERLGLNDSIPVQYVRWMERALRGDFGISYKYKQDVWTVIGARVGNTLLLGGLGFVLTFALALLLGVLCAAFEGRWMDRILCRAGTLSSCVPEFWLSLVLILVFSVTLKLLPSGGAYAVGRENDAADRIRHLILPVTALVLSHLWYYAYMLRNRLLEETHADYVRMARAKGLSNGQILFRHCLRNAAPSYLSLMAASVPHILGGTYIVETVFSYPGLGTLSYESARYQDYNLLMVLCMMTGAAVIVCNLLAQAISARIDPRLAGEEAAHG